MEETGDRSLILMVFSGRIFKILLRSIDCILPYDGYLRSMYPFLHTRMSLRLQDWEKKKSPNNNVDATRMEEGPQQITPEPRISSPPKTKNIKGYDSVEDWENDQGSTDEWKSSQNVDAGATNEVEDQEYDGESLDEREALQYADALATQIFINANRSSTTGRWTLLHWDCVCDIWDCARTYKAALEQCRGNSLMHPLYRVENTRSESALLHMEMSSLIARARDGLHMRFDKDNPGDNTPEAHAYERLFHTGSLHDLVAWRRIYLESASQLGTFLKRLAFVTHKIHADRSEKQDLMPPEGKVNIKSYTHWREVSLQKELAGALEDLREMVQKYQNLHRITVKLLGDMNFAEDLTSKIEQYKAEQHVEKKSTKKGWLFGQDGRLLAVCDPVSTTGLDCKIIR